MAISVATAKAFVANLDIVLPPHPGVSALVPSAFAFSNTLDALIAAPPAVTVGAPAHPAQRKGAAQAPGGIGDGFVPKQDVDQAAVVGSNLVGFIKGVTNERRTAIVNCALLAQLAANKLVGSVNNAHDIQHWYDAYYNVLAHTGWVVESTNLSSYAESDDNVQINQSILKVAAILLGPATTAYKVIEATLNALKTDGDPWITLFSKSSKQAQVACFQSALASQEPNGDFLVKLMAFGLTKVETTTQLLFFKWKHSGATLLNCSGQVTIDEDVLTAVMPTVKDKLRALVREYIDELPNLQQASQN